MKIRKAPLEYKDDKQIFDYAETLGESVQCFANVLENELLDKYMKTGGQND